MPPHGSSQRKGHHLSGTRAGRAQEARGEVCGKGKEREDKEEASSSQESEESSEDEGSDSEHSETFTPPSVVEEGSGGRSGSAGNHTGKGSSTAEALPDLEVLRKKLADLKTKTSSVQEKVGREEEDARKVKEEEKRELLAKIQKEEEELGRKRAELERFREEKKRQRKKSNEGRHDRRRQDSRSRSNRLRVSSQAGAPQRGAERRPRSKKQDKKEKEGAEAEARRKDTNESLWKALRRRLEAKKERRAPGAGVKGEASGGMKSHPRVDLITSAGQAGAPSREPN